MFKKKCEFIMGAASKDGLPKESLPEVAFVGRSNVGKSSLLNALVQNKGMARVSNTPGRTQQINFFRLDNKLMLVDLPGYGFAKASKSDRAKWTRLMKYYLGDRRTLRRVFVLVDSRHGLKDSDEEMMDLLDDAAVPYQIILTKIDKISKTALDSVKESVKEGAVMHAALLEEQIATTTKKNIGLDKLRNSIKEIF
jgi:GTP-binding protein